MTLHDYAELVAYWLDHPPSHLIDGAMLDRKPPDRKHPDRPRRPGSPAPTTSPPPIAGAAGIDGLLRLARNGICRVEDLRDMRQ